MMSAAGKIKLAKADIIVVIGRGMKGRPQAHQAARAVKKLPHGSISAVLTRERIPRGEFGF
jgi:electron transfer flavoprotein alpha subunit